ncbi:MSMEG_6728 family protein [Allokutzneria sp. NRRL B-24872]|uniref:MSMEG_6728 family protein n=1 Tax=Allokutzneria sp. NRRL B-24872 TaxID=1137961 RepID=UPI000A36D522
MQTFLPHVDFAASARVLDDRRLGKQRAETVQILRALVWPEYGWKHHPAVTMWRGFTRALVAYGVQVCREWTVRGHTDSTVHSLLEFTGGVVPHQHDLIAAGAVPPWLGDEAVHLSHRSALVRKNPEHYRRFFPDVPDDLPYTWPRPVFPRWPVRGHMSVEDATELLGVDQLTEAERAAVEDLRPERRVELHSNRARQIGLLAGLCTEGRTLWLLPGEPLAVGRGERPELSARARPGTARPAGPREVTATRDEWANDPEFLFHRGAVPVGADIGLVVLDGVEDAPDTKTPVLRLR